MGTFSSPRVTDLNGDGIGDVILGAGRQEFYPCDSAIMALDGRNGQFLWKRPAIDQIFGSAALKDINADGTEDVIIGGRSAELQAINGKSGALIWKFSPKRKEKWYNFYNPQFIPDQNSDGLEDILISNGGDVKAPPYDPNRPPGKLVVLNAKDGTLLASALVPDGKETYMSVVSLPTPNATDHWVVFGTGGETIGGNLYVCRLSDIMKGNLSAARLLATSPDKGFIAPVAWVDLNQDRIPDIVANAVDGRLLAFDGKTFDPLWQIHMPDTEAYSSIGIGYFNSDSIPDLMLSYAQGSWPDLEWNKQFMVNGKDGNVEFQDSLGFYQTSSPVIYDFTQDGRDDVLLTINLHILNELNIETHYIILGILDFTTYETIAFTELEEGSNIASTPWIGDMDQDGFLDIVYCHSSTPRPSTTFLGLKIHRIGTDIPATKPVLWGAYMGSHYDGLFSHEP